MLVGMVKWIGRGQMVLAALAAALLIGEPSARRYGDRLQIALPLVAWGCAAMNRGGAEFAARFAGMLAVAHGSKLALGTAPVNLRPNGHDKGFPSAHTAAASLGASALVHDCIPASRGAAAVVVIAAAFVAGSRIDAGQHDIWQTLAGALLGWGAERVLRRDRVLRGRLASRAAKSWRRMRDWAGAGLRGLVAPVLRRMVWRWRLWPAFSVVSQILLPAALALMLTAPTGARAEMEVSAYGGAQGALSGTIKGTGVPKVKIDWEGKSFAMPPYYGFRATWWQTPVLGFGVEFNHAKIYADDPPKYGFDRFEFSDGMNLLTLNLWRRWPDTGLGGGRLTPYAGLGVGVAIPHVEVTPIGKERTWGYQVSGPVVQAVVGGSWRLNARWSAFAEMKATVSKHDIDLDSGGDLKTTVKTGAINVGLSYRF